MEVKVEVKDIMQVLDILKTIVVNMKNVQAVLSFLLIKVVNYFVYFQNLTRHHAVGTWRELNG